MSAQLEVQITATLLTGKMRLRALPHFFRHGMTLVEPLIFNLMDRYCEEYNGGYWEFFKLSNGGFFMSPGTEGVFRLVNAENYSDVELSAEATGVAICLMAYSHLSWHSPEHIFNSQFHWLRQFALDHPEAAGIFRFID